jgi:hypothetical protein
LNALSNIIPAKELNVKIPELPSGVWSDSLLKKNFNEPGKASKDSAVCKPFVNNLKKNFMGRKFVSKSLKRSKSKIGESSSTSASISSSITSPTSSLLTPNDSRTTDTLDGNPFLRSDNLSLTSLVIQKEGDPVPNPIGYHPDQLIFSTPVSLDLHDSNAVDSPCISDYASTAGAVNFSSALSYQASSSGSFKENITQKNESLFSDNEDDDDQDQEMKAVKDHILNEIKEMEEFAGCELLPMNFQAKKPRKKNPPTAKALKKKNDEYCCKVDLKKKSFASKGYKKINVQRIKRQSHYKKKKSGRNSCFKCGQEGHWANECNNKDPDDEGFVSLVSYRNAPILPADCIVNDVSSDHGNDNERQEEQDQESIHHGNQEVDHDILLFDYDDETTRETLFF